ncbi:MAG: NUDIX hydrolase [Ktedonobacterales bacterium]
MPTVGVFASIVDIHGRMLCVKQNTGSRKWTLPGGRMETGESPIEALIREVREETGYHVEIGDLIGVYSMPAKDNVVLSFVAHIVGRSPWQPTGEIAEIGFFGRDELPQQMRQRPRERIADAFAGERGVVRVFERRLRGKRDRYEIDMLIRSG